MNGSRALILIGGALAAMAASAGCATRGYVRDQVAGLRTQTEQSRSTMRADLDQVRVEGIRALSLADAASQRADSSRSLALGHVGYREASRHQVHFAFDSAELDAAAMADLDQAVMELEREPQYFAELYGFADPTGPEGYNLQLGQRRASAVFRYLASRVPTQLARFNTISFGETPPDHERAAWGDQGKQQRQVLVVLVERIPPATPPAFTTKWR